MNNIQESVAAPPLLEILRCGHERLVDGEIREEDNMFAEWRSALESVVANVDTLRTNTTLKVVEILSPAQSVRCLAAVSELKLRIRSWGLQREAEARQSGGNE
ncbi:protein RESPONSE TO ABA AND SALT 1-like [Carya illinoinensis]|uniref:protein RESPONSE TO ABA AND SALT 1-like n=1 Tax=Carya illinoinensis TaxID=32201 RepID=UPI001C71D508|nr:protein RESPONSE TO ABA AND SALT 1-like [Carya illinoinensis]